MHDHRMKSIVDTISNSENEDQLPSMIAYGWQWQTNEWPPIQLDNLTAGIISRINTPLPPSLPHDTPSKDDLPKAVADVSESHRQIIAVAEDSYVIDTLEYSSPSCAHRCSSAIILVGFTFFIITNLAWLAWNTKPA
jgi:hypothetical protein